MPMANLLLAIVGAFLVLDSLLAFAFGKRYMLLGLGRMPASYRNLIARLSGLQRKRLLAIKLAEFSAGLVLVWLARVF